MTTSTRLANLLDQLPTAAPFEITITPLAD
jgi:hypothetical protein